MKLLIITQIVDQSDSNLGFFHRWIEEFAKHCESVEVICLKKGMHYLPKNVRVHSLGKEHNTSRLTRLTRFLKYSYALRNDYDAVLVHMNPEYVVLMGWLWKRWGKKIGLWYAHRSDTKKLRLAVRLCDYIFTVSKDSFAIPTPKLKVVGHGVDTELFKPDIKEESTMLRIFTAGRIARSKHILEMLALLTELDSRKEHFSFTVVGAPITEVEKQYASQLEDRYRMVTWRNNITLLGSKPHTELPDILRAQDVALNFSTTGNMDKAGLEALSAGVPLLTTNPAFEELLSPYGLYVPSIHPIQLADALQSFFERPDQPAVLATLRNKVVAEHSLSRLIPVIVSTYGHS